MFCTDGSPNGVGSIADAVPLDQFPSHRRAIGSALMKFLQCKCQSKQTVDRLIRSQRDFTT
jgi:hypothetical protein